MSKEDTLAEQRDGYEHMWRNSAASELELKRKVRHLEQQIETLKNKLKGKPKKK